MKESNRPTNEQIKMNRYAFERGARSVLTLAPLRLLFWRAALELAKWFMDAGYVLHCYARGRIRAAHEARQRKPSPNATSAFAR